MGSDRWKLADDPKPSTMDNCKNGLFYFFKALKWCFYLLLALLAFGLLFNSITRKETKILKEPDKALYIRFHKQFMSKMAEADALHDPLKKALQSGNVLEATSIALKIEGPALRVWGDIKRVEAPDLQNAEAKKKLDMAKEALSGAYLYKANFARDWLKFSELQDIKKMAQLKNQAEEIRMLYEGGMTFLVETAVMLDVKLEELK